MERTNELPNLKICIENDADSESDEEKPIIEDIVDSESDEESDDDGEITSKRSESEKSETEANSDTETQATLEVSTDHKLLHEPKRYENRDGEFVLGFDPLSKESREQSAKRAERFGIRDSSSALSEEDLKALYYSLGITEQDLEERGERGIRLESLHLRGVDEMSTSDVFKYFQGFVPGSLEWIDDSSCNVIWGEAVTAARAMIHLSKSAKENNINEKRDRRKSQESIEKNESGDKDTGQAMEVENAESVTPQSKPDAADSTAEKETESKSKAEDDFDYNLDLMSDNEDGEEGKHKQKDDQEDKQSEKSGTKEEGELAMEEDSQGSKSQPDKDNEENENSRETEDLESKQWKQQRIEYPMPPGQWRVGLPYHNKAHVLYMRYATKADKKQAGAEKKSKYYRKYGNPNFGGMRGLISGSKKRKIWSSKYRKEEEEAKRMVSKSKKFTGIPEETTFDDHLAAALQEIKRKNKSKDDSEESMSTSEEEFSEEEVCSEEEDFEKQYEEQYRRPQSRRLEDDQRLQTERFEEEKVEPPVADDIDDELRALLSDSPPPIKKRTMRMHADDEEEQIEKKRVRTMELAKSRPQHGSFDHRDRSRFRGGLDAYSDRNSHSTGIDLRSRLGRKRQSEDSRRFSERSSLNVDPD